MQIGTSVNSESNTYYGMKQNVRQFQGIKSNAGVSLSVKEVSLDGGFANLVDSDYYFGHSLDVEKEDRLKDIYLKMRSIATKTNFKSSSYQDLTASSIKTVETRRYLIEEMEGGYLRIYDKEREEGFHWKLSENQIQVDYETGKKILINDWGSGFFNMVVVDDELEKGIREALGADELAEKELTGFTVHRNQNTGIYYITANGYERQGGAIIFDEQTSQKLNSLAQEYLDQYPGVIKSFDDAWFYATFEVRGLAKRTPNGIVMIHPDSISFQNKDEENGWVNIEETETNTDIIVKPDGSRVLVVTMNMGGMETTMSLEISKPTTMPNDSSEQGKEAETIETDKITEEDLVNEYKCD